MILHFCFLVFVLVIFTPPPPPLFLLFQSFSGSSCFLFVDPVFFLWITVLFCHFSKIVLCFWFRSVFSFLNLELFVTVPLFKSSLKKDRAILSETSGQRKLVCWCWGRAKRLTWPSKNPKNQKDLQCLCKMHRCVELWSIECVRDKVRDTDSDYVMRKPSRCWLGAVPRYWNVVASCFRFISFAKNTSAALASRAGISQPILLLFFLFSCSWICLQNVASDFFIRSQNLVAFERRQIWL